MNDARDGWLAVQFEEQKGDTVTLKTAEGEVTKNTHTNNTMCVIGVVCDFN